MQRPVLSICVGLGLLMAGAGQVLAQASGGTVYSDRPLSADDLESVFGLAPAREAAPPPQTRTRGLSRGVAVMIGDTSATGAGGGGGDYASAAPAPAPRAKSLSVLIEFGSGSDTIDPRSRGQLDGVVDFLNRHGDAVMLVIGHTDNRGSAAANQALSERRASAVRRLLTSQGVPERQVAAMGQGSSRPLPGEAAFGDRQRRVEFVLVPLN